MKAFTTMCLKDRHQGGDLYTYLRINRKRRYRRRSKAGRVHKGIPDRIGIEKRPKSVEQRIGYGDWESPT